MNRRDLHGIVIESQGRPHRQQLASLVSQPPSSPVRGFRRQRGGDLSVTQRKAELMTTTTYTVTGMTCGHCVAAVTEELSVLPGVTEVAIGLVPEGLSTVTVSSSGPLAEDTVRAAVDEAGYELAGAAHGS